tara:strand:- start:291 stop:395 length:105 start_codon:yes stop_codon:yes gene_type:complete
MTRMLINGWELAGTETDNLAAQAALGMVNQQRLN